MQIAAANKIQHYAVDLGQNITLPCTAPHKGGVQWSRVGRNVHSRPLDDGSLQILDVNREDAGMYACTPANDAREDVKQEINLTVRSNMTYCFRVWRFTDSSFVYLFVCGYLCVFCLSERCCRFFSLYDNSKEFFFMLINNCCNIPFCILFIIKVIILNSFQG